MCKSLMNYTPKFTNCLLVSYNVTKFIIIIPLKCFLITDMLKDNIIHKDN